MSLFCTVLNLAWHILVSKFMSWLTSNGFRSAKVWRATGWDPEWCSRDAASPRFPFGKAFMCTKQINGLPWVQRTSLAIRWMVLLYEQDSTSHHTMPSIDVLSLPPSNSGISAPAHASKHGFGTNNSPGIGRRARHFCRDVFDCSHQDQLRRSTVPSNLQI